VPYRTPSSPYETKTRVNRLRGNGNPNRSAPPVRVVRPRSAIRKRACERYAFTCPEISVPRIPGSTYDELKSLMNCPNCHCRLPRLHLPKRFGCSSPMKPPSPVPCPTEAPKFTFPVRFSFTRKTMSTSP